MPLAPGQTLSCYEILDPLGAGAMGEVYRAKDKRLDREVAIKVLPDHLAEDAERLQRFQREAKSIASLNHPKVAQIHSVDQEESTWFLVLELVPGETLEERIARRPLSIEEALSVCCQIAEGLEAAHEAGVIHRDLKPANVRIKPDGTVKLLDFGLAKPSGGGRENGSTTDSVLVTEEGRLIGTPTYMAPEQVRGKPIDRRVDLWAFGCVLYECLTGARAFVGETVSDVLTAVLQDEPDWTALPPGVGPRVQQLLRRCLHKDAQQRLRDIGDARLELQHVLAEGDTEVGLAAATASRTRPGWLAAALALGAVVALGAVALTGGGWSESEAPAAVRAALDLPSSLELDRLDRSIAVSPDGSQVALVAKDAAAGTRQIYLRPLDRLVATPLAGTEGASYPFWSPDGTAIGFFADLSLKRVDLASGIVRPLCGAPAGRGGTWSQHGSIVFAPSASGGLFEVSEEGGEPTPFTTPKHEGEHHRLPHFLPDGRGILYLSLGFERLDAGAWPAEVMPWSPVTSGIEVFAFHPETGTNRKLLETPTEAFYVEPGYLAYVQDSNLMLQPFDPDALEVTGEAQPIAADVQHDINRLFLQMDVVAGGTLVYQQVPQLEGMGLAWLDRQGQVTPIPADPQALVGARVSPDGRRAAVANRDPYNGRSVVLIDLERGIETQVSPVDSFGTNPVWSRDGSRLALQTLVGPHYQLAVVDLKPGGGPLPLTRRQDLEPFPEDFTHDGRILFTRRSHVDKRGDLMIVDADGSAPATPFLADATNDSDARLSPDGQWIVFATHPDGADTRTALHAVEGATLSISAYPTTGRWQITRPDAAVRSWGWLKEREIYYQDAEARVWVVEITPVDGGGDPVVGTPQPLFANADRALDGCSIVDYSPVRDQFLVALRGSDPAPSPRLIVVGDWRAAVR